MTRLRALRLAASASALALAACVKAPNVVVVDRATALELEAAGTFPHLDKELERATLGARPSPVTREQLEAAGLPRPVVPDVAGGAGEASDAERIDALLEAHCLGEAKDGALVERKESCAVKNVPHLGLLLERANRDRAQIWEWLRGQRPARTADEVRRAWREVHLRTVPCNAPVESDAGEWEPKKC